MKYLRRLAERIARKVYFIKVKLGLVDPEQDFWSSFHTCAGGFGPPDPPHRKDGYWTWPHLNERDLELMQPNPAQLLEQVKLYPHPRGRRGAE